MEDVNNTELTNNADKKVIADLRKELAETKALLLKKETQLNDLKEKVKSFANYVLAAMDRLNFAITEAINPTTTDAVNTTVDAASAA